MAKEQKKDEQSTEEEMETDHKYDPDSDMCHTCGGCGPEENE